MLEHDADPALTIKEAIRVLRVCGVLLISAAGRDYPPHEVDAAGGHYRNIFLPELSSIIKPLLYTEVYEVDRVGRFDSVAIGFKG